MLKKLKQFYEFIFKTPKSSKQTIIWMIVFETIPFYLINLLVNFVFLNPLGTTSLISIIANVLTTIFWIIVGVRRFKSVKTESKKD